MKKTGSNRTNPLDSCFADRYQQCHKKAKVGADEPLLVQSLPCTYQQLLNELLRTNFDQSLASEKFLPRNLAERVLSYLTVEGVQHEQVCATTSSSHDGMHPLSQSLIDNNNTWWLSRPGTMPNGRGEQWVQYSMNWEGDVRRISTVSIKIPPMPLGPLSVREFCLQKFSFERGWHSFTSTFAVANRCSWRQFHFAGVDVDEVRLVCLSNQISDYMTNLKAKHPNDTELISRLSKYESVGFFSVKFE